MCFPHRRSPSAYFEGTHDVRSAWGNTDAIDCVAIASSLRATNGRRAIGNTNRLKAVSLRFVRQLRTQTAQSLVLFRQARRPLRSPPCGSNFVFEITHSVYKYASNKCSLTACVLNTQHQTIVRAELRFEFLPVLELIAHARLCG